MLRSPHRAVALAEEIVEGRVASVMEVGARSADEAERRRVECAPAIRLVLAADVVDAPVGEARPGVATRAARFVGGEDLSSALDLRFVLDNTRRRRRQRRD